MKVEQIVNPFICVYCSASQKLESSLYKLAYSLGEKIAEQSWTLIYGGSSQGLMASVAEGCLHSKGSVIGVIPEGGILMNETPHPKIQKTIYTRSMRERRQIMENISNAFIVLPGGVGTLEEFAEIIVSRSLKLHDKPLIFFNYNSFFDEFFTWMDKLYQKSFINTSINNIYQVSESVDSVIKMIKHGLF